jgi:hypothetical protein
MSGAASEPKAKEERAPGEPRKATRDTSHGIWRNLGKGGEGAVGQYVGESVVLCVCVMI